MVRGRAKRGDCNPSSPPFGYSYDKNLKILVINEDEAKIVRYIFQYLADGGTLAKLVRELRENCILPRPSSHTLPNGEIEIRPNYWRVDKIRSLIGRAVYRGVVRARNPEAPRDASPKDTSTWVEYAVFRMPMKMQR